MAADTEYLFPARLILGPDGKAAVGAVGTVHPVTDEAGLSPIAFKTPDGQVQQSLTVASTGQQPDFKVTGQPQVILRFADFTTVLTSPTGLLLDAQTAAEAAAKSAGDFNALAVEVFAARDQAVQAASTAQGVDSWADIEGLLDTPEEVKDIPAAVGARLRYRGPYADGMVVSLNDLVETSAGRLAVSIRTEDFTAGGEPTQTNTYWRVLPGGNPHVPTYENALAGSVFKVYKTGTAAAGTWPGGTTSTWTRPTSRKDVHFVLVGWAPFPPIVATADQGTSVAGMYDGDAVHVVAAP